ncbi:MAG TPA: phage tail protein I [Azospirillum sp.]|nr:phage tail protein I [Azospirillum sp.]
MADLHDLPLPAGIDREPFRSLAALAAAELRAIDAALPRLAVYRIGEVDAGLLPVLGWQFHLFGEGWEECVTDAQRRALVWTAIELHRRKGTPHAVKRVVGAIGHSEVELTEGLPPLLHDRAARRDGRERYDGRGRWARYRLRVPLGDADTLTPADVARIGRAAAAWAPARCRLDMVVVALPPAVGRDAEPAVTVSPRALVRVQAARDPAHNGMRSRGDGTRYGARRIAPTLTARLTITVTHTAPPSVASSIAWDDGATRWDGGLTAWSL